jgi:NAD(P)-dependent dehydrogenase (short-subunit alcohol dehydrogenase family)
MQELTGKVAVVTGAASGIGRALSDRAAAEGMAVVMADVEAPTLAAAAAEVRATGARVLDVVTDVAAEAAVARLADAAFAEFGAVHLLCQNAGVSGGGGPSWEIPDNAWQWTFGVNLWSIVYGLRAFVPRMIAQGEGHIVNTASSAGLKTLPFVAPYAATKHAVVAISEALCIELGMFGPGLGVSVLCPGWVDTRIADSDRNWPAHLGELPGAPDGGDDMREVSRGLLAAGIPPSTVAGAVFDAVVADRFWVFPDGMGPRLAHARIDEIDGDTKPVITELYDGTDYAQPG